MLRMLFAGGRRFSRRSLRWTTLEFYSIIMIYDPPRDIYKALKLDKELLDIKLEAHENAAQERATRKIAYSVSRDMLRFKNKPPR